MNRRSFFQRLLGCAAAFIPALAVKKPRLRLPPGQIVFSKPLVLTDAYLSGNVCSVTTTAACDYLLIQKLEI